MLLTADPSSLNWDPIYFPINPRRQADSSPARPAASQPAVAPAATSSPSTVQRKPPAPATDQQVIALWDIELEKRMTAGRTRAEATRELVSEEPKLHQQYLDAYKAEMQKGRRPGARSR